MNSIEDYQNLVELLKQALLFYAEKSNYIGDIYRNSNIAIDNGSQARFALEKIKELEEVYNKIQTDYTEEINKYVTLEDVGKLFNEFKNNLNGNKI